jgi:glycosyltransferase involved in cell wall biosynthesis
MNPLVSILVPARKCEDYIGKMIASIRAQTYSPWEMIISAVQSDTDDTFNVARCFVASMGKSRIRVVREATPGMAVNMNACYLLSKGEIIARQEADDWSDPRRLELEVAELQKGFDIVSCGMVRYMRDGSLRHMDVPGMVPYDFATFCCPHGPGSDGIIAWRWVYEKVGLYDPAYDASADTDWTFRALVVTPLLKWGHVAEDLYYYRDHPQQMTKRIGKEGSAIHLERQAFYQDRIFKVHGLQMGGAK